MNVHVQVNAHPKWELGIFIVSKETEIYTDCIPIHQAFATFRNMYKYHCTILKHGGKVQHWNYRTFCTLGDNWSMFFCACNNKTWRRFRFGRRIHRTYNRQYFFRWEKISLCLFFSGIFAQKVPARRRKTEYFTTMALLENPLMTQS